MRCFNVFIVLFLLSDQVLVKKHVEHSDANISKGNLRSTVNSDNKPARLLSDGNDTGSDYYVAPHDDAPKGEGIIYSQSSKGSKTSKVSKSSKSSKSGKGSKSSKGSKTSTNSKSFPSKQGSFDPSKGDPLPKDAKDKYPPKDSKYPPKADKRPPKGIKDDASHSKSGDGTNGSKSGGSKKSKSGGSKKSKSGKGSKGSKSGKGSKSSKSSKGSKSSKSGKNSKEDVESTPTPTPPNFPTPVAPPSFDSAPTPPNFPTPLTPPSFDSVPETTPPPFDISDCASYALDWLIELELSCTNDDGTKGFCACPTMAALIDAGAIDCDLPNAGCPVTCGVCLTCACITGCRCDILV